MTTASPPLSLPDQLREGLERIAAPKPVLEFVEEWRARVFHPAVRHVLTTGEQSPVAIAELLAGKSRELWTSFERLLESIAEMMHVDPEKVIAISAERSAAAETDLTQEHAIEAFKDPAATNAYLWSLEEFSVVSSLPPEVVPKAARDHLHGCAFGLMALGLFAQDPNIGDREVAGRLAVSIRASVLRIWTLHRQKSSARGQTPGAKKKKPRQKKLTATDDLEVPLPTVHWADRRGKEDGAGTDGDVPEVHWE